MDAKRYFVVWAIVVLLSVALACGCGGITPPIFQPIFGDGWDSGPYEIGASGIDAPDAVRSGSEATITVVVQFGARRQTLFDKKVDVSSSDRTVNIKLIARDQSGCFACDVPPPFLVELPVVLDRPGIWEIRTKNMSREVRVHGDWSGAEHAATMVDFSLYHEVFTGVPASLRVYVEHPSGEWFCSRSELWVDENEHSMTIEVYERGAESVLPDEPWTETVWVPVIFPSEERWSLFMGDSLIAERIPQPSTGFYDTPEKRTDDLLFHLRHTRPSREATTPVDMRVPEEMRVGEIFECEVAFLYLPLYTLTVYGADYRFDVENLTLTAELFTGHWWITRDKEDVCQAAYATVLAFPSPGEWAVAFQSEQDEPFTTTATVLPVEEV